MNQPGFRPPAEADSLILQVDEGCPHNRCTFCGMYRGMRYRRRSLAEVEEMVAEEAEGFPNATRVFLADGDVMSRPYEELHAILSILAQHFPLLARVSVYTNGSSIAAKSADQLQALRSLKLRTLYMGLESGDEEILRACRKGETAAAMADAAETAQRAGLRVSVMVLLGLGGAELTDRHAGATAAILNRMQPRLLSALRVIPVPGTELLSDVQSRRFTPLTEFEVVRELRDLVCRLDLRSTVFRANHSSNVMPFEARFPRDKQRLLCELDALLASGALDRRSPGRTPLWL